LISYIIFITTQQPFNSWYQKAGGWNMPQAPDATLPTINDPQVKANPQVKDGSMEAATELASSANWQTRVRNYSGPS